MTFDEWLEMRQLKVRIPDENILKAMRVSWEACEAYRDREYENPSMPYKNCEHWEDVIDRCRITGLSCDRANGEECEDYRPLCRVCLKPLTNPDHVVCSQKCSDAESL